jgi:hypothetical protein
MIHVFVEGLRHVEADPEAHDSVPRVGRVARAVDVPERAFGGSTASPVAGRSRLSAVRRAGHGVGSLVACQATLSSLRVPNLSR